MRSILLVTFTITVLSAPAFAEQMRRLDYDAPKQATPLYVSKTQDEPEEEPAEKVWERYKSLAAGENHKEEKHAKAEEPPPSPKVSGFAALLQQYNENKKSRGGMRSMDVK